MKKLLIAAALFAALRLAYSQAFTNNPPQPAIPINLYTNTYTNALFVGTSDYPVVFYFSAPNMRDFWTRGGTDQIDILFTTNIAEPLTNWSVHSNIQMSPIGLWVGNFNTNSEFFKINIRRTN